MTPVSSEDLTPYHRLIKLIETELSLAGSGKTTELQAAVRRTGLFLNTLPSPTPAARPLILRAAALRGRVTIETERLQAGIHSSRAALQRSRRMTRSYIPHPGNRLDTKA
jgi:hypothetical protein